MFTPSMKVPPKRKGNLTERALDYLVAPSMKVPPKRKGNFAAVFLLPGA